MFNVVLAQQQQAGGVNWVFTIALYALIFAAFYFFLIRPQKKRQKEQEALMASVETGDSILTTSGFYGVVIDITDDIVIVEFGSNKNCRIPMKKEAIVEVEKAKN